ncbi:unnamed protein product [Ectocarpus sp. CCAP 1310/34]|nr:unnamed protein product [Ectocarpus sp. CCAP 1310/34]
MARSECSDLGDGLLRGKVTREILQKAFGPALLALLEEFAKQEQSRHSSSSKRRGGGEEKRDEGSPEDARGITLDDLAGTDTEGGKLQVVVSGPNGFVFYVESILAEMGVPSEAIVFLD